MTHPDSTQSNTGAQGLYCEDRPWGRFTVLMDLPHYKVKHIVVLPGQRLSLQMHHQREEHWMITQGEAMVTVGDETTPKRKGDYIFIPREAKHRIANTGPEPVEFIEVQLGTYFGEDDIVRFQDDYNRIAPPLP